VTEATLFGRPLPEGGTIGVAAPASGFENRSEVLRGVEWWESKGYRVKLGEHVFERDDYVAGDERGRAADLMTMFADDEVDVVQSLQGGFGSAQTIPHLDFDVIAANPKPFVGYSDITALHVAIRQRTGLATFYGYGLVGMGEKESTAFSRDRLVDVLRGKGAGEVPRDPDDLYVRGLNGGRVTAPLVGGCLWLLLQTMGTPWEFDVGGCIFFLEDYDAPPWYVDGMLTQLAHAGKLADVRGVVVGDMEKCDWREARPEWPRTRSIEDVLERHLEPLQVPVLYKLPLGHGKHLASIPLGVQATLDADARTLTCEHAGLEPDGEGETP
jgi:muramoyltetrapeptide carboxypeptidase